MGKNIKGISKRVFNMFGFIKADRKKLSLSIVSLVLSAVVLVSATFCWYALSQADANGRNISLSVGQGLRVNDLGESFQNIADDSYLLPASSVDGRNLYFPADGTDFSTTTSKMTFRTANAGDRNYDYVQYDFNLTAEANYTGIYLDKDTSLSIEVPDDASADYKTACAKAQKALRAAIYYEKMEKPAVFNAQNNPSSVNAVDDVDRTTGRFIESSQQVAVPFRDYSYGKRQLAMLNQGETRPFSLIIWLEGTDSNCVSDGVCESVMLKQIVLNLKFTTTWDNKTTIKFIDNTDNKDVKNFMANNPGYSLMLDYTNDSRDISHLKFTMYKSSNFDTDNAWYCNIPDNAYNDLTFQIVNDATGEAEYEWTESPNGTSTRNRGTASVYYVDTFDPEKGHWHDGDIEDQGAGHDIGEIDDDDW